MWIEPRAARAARGFFLPALLMLLASGCDREYVYFRPAQDAQGASPGWVAQGKYRVPPQEGAVDVSLSARGTVESEKHEAEHRILEVRFDVRNHGSATWSLDPAAARIIDDDGRQVTGAAAYHDKSGLGQVSVAGGARETFRLAFDLPENVRFQSIGSVRVIWPYRYADKTYESQTKFIRIEEVTYYYPDDYYYGYYGPVYGPYYGGPPYPPYYYDPWYSDPWYGPRGYRHRWR